MDSNPAPAAPNLLPSTVTPIGILKAIARFEPKTTSKAALISIIGQGTGATGPLVVALAVDRGVIRGDLRWIFGAVAAYILIALVSYVTGRIDVRLTAEFAQRYMRRLRQELLAQIFFLDLDTFNREGSGVIVSRLTLDVDNVETFSERGVSIIVRGGLTAVVTAVVMSVSSVPLTLTVLVFLAGVFISTTRFVGRSYLAWMRLRDHMTTVISHATETVAGIETVHSYAFGSQRYREFEDLNRQANEARMAAAKVNATYYPTLEFLRVGALSGVVVVGGILAVKSTMTPGTVVAFTLYALRMFEPIQQLAEASFLVHQASVSFGKIVEFLSFAPSIKASGQTFHRGSGEIELRSASFRYGDDKPLALNDVSLSISHGETVALIRASGAGKSTLVKLLARFYDPTGGTIRIDGQDLRHVEPRSLRRHLILIPQETFLFHGTVRSNIGLARPDAPGGKVDEVCEALGIQSYLARLPQGLETEVSSGDSLSFGERQLVGLARALLADPLILLLDEATSNLDEETDKLIQEALTRLLATKTGRGDSASPSHGTQG